MAKAEFGQEFAKRSHVHWLYEVSIEAGLFGPSSVLVLAPTGQRD